jgi:hypothetical protein
LEVFFNLALGRAAVHVPYIAVIALLMVESHPIPAYNLALVVDNRVPIGAIEALK